MNSCEVGVYSAGGAAGAAVIGDWIEGIRYTSGRAERIDVEITAGHGLSASDELLLWGLFALVCFDQDAGFVYCATPHYVLRRLGLSNKSKGGWNYRDFRATMKRLGALSLYCRKFYDPELAEDREVVLRFVRGNLPLGDDTQRAWRFNFDPQLLALVRHKNGGMRFDVDTFRELGFAERRAFLPLSKIFYRQQTSPEYNLRHFCVNVLGYSPTIATKLLKQKLNRVLTNLLAVGVIQLPPGVKWVQDLHVKKGKGDYRFRLTRGSYFDKPEPTSVAKCDWKDSPLYDPIRSIGFEDRDVRWFLQTYDKHILQAWAHVTLAAMEGQARKFAGFQKNPKAYCRYHVKEHAARNILGEPDWYLEFRKEEDRKQHERDRAEYEASLAALRDAYQTAREEKLAELIQTDRIGYDKIVRLLTEFHAAWGDPLPNPGLSAT